MTADNFPQPPEPRRPAGIRRALDTSRRYDWRNAATIFGAVFISLAGVFAVVDYSARQSDRTHDNFDYRFDVVDQRLDLVDQRFKIVDQRFDAIDRKFEAVDRKFEAVDRQFVAVNQRLDKLDAKIDTKFDKLSDLLLTLIEQKATTDSAASNTKGGRSR